MHDRTRRLVCRVAFLALGVLPAAGVLAWSGWRGGAWHQRVCAAELSRTVGLQVSCNAVSYPRPGIVLYQGVELSDPETAAPLARMRFLETGGASTASAWVASQPEFDAAQLRGFWQLIDRRLREASDTATTTRLSAAEATLHWPAGSQTLTDVHGQLSMPGTAGGPRTATISFRIAGIDMTDPIQVTVTRERDGADGSGAAGSRLKTTIELHTSGAALPCAMLAVPLGVENRLGKSGEISRIGLGDGDGRRLGGRALGPIYRRRFASPGERAVPASAQRHGRDHGAKSSLQPRPAGRGRRHVFFRPRRGEPIARGGGD